MSEPRLEDLDHVEVDVEPLVDPRWSRIERGMFAKLDRVTDHAPSVRVSGRRLWIGGAAALAAVAAVTLVLGRSSIGLRSREPVRLVTTSSPSRFTIGESSLWIEPSSLVLVSGDDEHGVDVVLDHGRVTCEVAPRHGRPPFVVDAGEVRVQVVGTRFTVTRSAETSVNVDHGVVEVAVGGRVTVLRDGERWPAGSSPAPSADPSMGATQATPAAAPADPVESPSPTDGPPLPTQSPRRAALPGTSAGMGSRSASPSPGASPSAPANSPSGAAPPAVAGTGASAPAPPSAQQIFESAARIERARPDDAVALYRGLASGGTAWAGSALFALGRLEADRGHRAEAMRLLDEYVARYPRGLNVDDARALMQHLQ